MRTKEEQAWFTHACTYAAVGMAIIAPDDRWLQVNPYICGMLGYREEELLGTMFKALIHREDIEHERVLYAQLESGGRTSYQLEIRYMHKSGIPLWTLLSVSLICDGEGHLLHVISPLSHTPALSGNYPVLRKLALELRTAIAEHQLELYYQPKISLQSRQITGFEALIRWNHPIRGLVGPMDFIPAAEASGVIIQLGEWVIREACRQAARWQQAEFPFKRLAINISLIQFEQSNLMDILESSISETGVHPERIELEITESVMQSSERTIEVLHRLRAMGFYVTIDDFGTGYSSLSYLKRMPIDAIKMDKIFISDLGSQKDADIAVSIISLAKSLQIRLIAEGVETPEQITFLHKYLCEEVQGYLISRPLRADEMERAYDSICQWAYSLIGSSSLTVIV
ncbi:putative bifunctional diguanylate cyclase/phosphodiesterase [Paenibacillus gansuensis]|uniref:EAL domain-containing protein n=1 Tax=Paenibacillus gansuensis TaxID=306542 RepID=A0ABW5P8E1_9BACL